MFFFSQKKNVLPSILLQLNPSLSKESFLHSLCSFVSNIEKISQTLPWKIHPIYMLMAGSYPGRHSWMDTQKEKGTFFSILMCPLPIQPYPSFCSSCPKNIYSLENKTLGNPYRFRFKIQIFFSPNRKQSHVGYFKFWLPPRIWGLRSRLWKKISKKCPVKGTY